MYITGKRRKVKCATCGKVFYTTHPSKKTCSLECSCARKIVAYNELKKNNRIYKKSNKK